MATNRSYAMTVRSIKSIHLKMIKRHICDRHFTYEMILLWVWMSAIIFGTVVEMKLISVKGKL
jgi:hypothetical protein